MLKDLKRASFRHKNNKLGYYLVNYIRRYTPASFFRKQLEKKLSHLNEMDAGYIYRRVEYYNRLKEITTLPQGIKQLSEYNLRDHQKTYIFDTYEYTRFFPPHFRIAPLFGDITHVPDIPSIAKSRPVEGDNTNSVLLKLDKIRHFLFVNDKNDFEKKKNMLICRTKAAQEHRIRFLNMYINHPMCNIGQVNRNMNPHLIRNRLTIEEHLKYKFILCLEGNDVASNLKWVTIAVMPKPKYETWFMEGVLIPDYHYILIKDDYSDLESRLSYYIEHTEEALQIIGNAHQYIEQFRNKKQEDMIALLVLKKYFEKTGQTFTQSGGDLMK